MSQPNELKVRNPPRSTGAGCPATPPRQPNVPRFANARLLLAASLFAAVTALGASQSNSTPASGTDPGKPFPNVSEVLQGRVFESKFERDVFFLRRIHDSYPAHWPGLLSANIIVEDHVHAPDKLLRFVDEVGAAMAETDNPVAVTNLSPIVSNPVFYANTNAYRPGVLQAAAWALIKIGPRGREALAEAFTEEHYRTDPASLEVLADAIGRSTVADPKLKAALESTAFTFTAANGGAYPRCTEEAARNLLRLPEGTPVLAKHLKPKEVFDDPVRFQAVVGAIAAVRPAGLVTNLHELAKEVSAKLDKLATSPGTYREALVSLQAGLKKAIEL